MSSGWIIAIIDIVFVLFLAIGFWAGAARGVKRSVLDLGIMVAGVIIVGFITPPITNAILGIKITSGGTTTSLEGFFVQMLSNDATIGKLLDASPTLSLFLQKLPSILLCSIVFLILNLVMRLVAYVIYKIIAVCAFKTKKKEKEKGLKRNWWLGGIIGTLKMFVLVLVIFMPLTSLVKLADKVLPEPTVTAASEQTEMDPLSKQLSSLPKQIKQATSCINSSAFGVLNGAVGLDDFIFDDMSKFTVKGQTVQVRKDLDMYYELYRDAFDVINSTKDVNSINWKDMDALYSRATQGGFYKTILLNAAGELIVEYPTLLQIMPDLTEFEYVFDDIKNGLEANGNYAQYFSSDFDKIYHVISEFGKSGYLSDVMGGDKDVVDGIVVLATKYNNLVADSISSLMDLNLMKNAFSSAIDFALSKMSGSESDIFKNVGDVFTKEDGSFNDTEWAKFKNEIKTVVEKVGEVGKKIEESEGVTLGEIVSDLKKVLLVDYNAVEDVLTNVGGILDKVDGMAIMTDKTGQKILPKLFEKMGIDNLLEIEEIDGEEVASVENYTDFFKFLAKPVKNLLSLNLYDSISNGMNMNSILKTLASRLSTEKKGDEYSTLLEDTILPLFRVKIIREIAFNEVMNMKNSIVDFSKLRVEKAKAGESAPETNGEEGEEEKGELDVVATYMNWKHDLPLLAQIITELESKEFDPATHQTLLDYLLEQTDNSEEDKNDDKIKEVIKKLDDPEDDSDDDLVDKVVSAILEAKCTTPLKEVLSTEVSNAILTITGQSVTFDLKDEDGTVFAGSDSQTAQIVAIFKEFIKLINSTNLDELDFKSMDPETLGGLVDAIQKNAFRNELGLGTAEGVTKPLFMAIMKKAEAEFGIDDMLAALKKESYAQINFRDIFKLAQLASESNEFAQQFKDVVFNTHEEGIQEQDVEQLIDKVKENEETVKEMLDIAKDNDIHVDLDEGTKSKVEEYLNKQNDIDPEIKKQLENFFGLSTGAQGGV